VRPSQVVDDRVHNFVYSGPSPTQTGTIIMTISQIVVVNLFVQST